ncbi:MAG: biotin/lipoyl-binding protein [Prevotellaceae bacterium]|nr:biotin/lipoyl-binding protein [Prevotella sp.]MDD7257610.1 biotin/lipoyl-binding protein [Prevotellaceae bacterium]MDY6130916.1 biotin/lipoyl-containing protein [Prevotella sp.]
MDKYQYKVNGVNYDVEIEAVEGNIAKVNVNGKSFEVELKNPLKSTHKPKVELNTVKQVSPVNIPAAKPATTPSGKGAKVTAPLPGTITEIRVAVGDTVKTGDTVVVLEAMKMQNSIEAENSGTVTSVSVNKGDTVMEGATLITIA